MGYQIAFRYVIGSHTIADSFLVSVRYPMSDAFSAHFAGGVRLRILATVENPSVQRRFDLVSQGASAGQGPTLPRGLLQ